MKIQNMPTMPPPQRLALRITPAAERAIRGGHPWLFADAITRQSGDGRPGDLAVIFDRKGRFLAVGLFDPDSVIRVRVLQQGQPAAINEAWFRAQITAAAQLRAELPPQTTGYRLVHGENDGLPGLVVDRYGDTAVLKLYTSAWVPHLAGVMKGVTAVLQPNRIILRLSRETARQTEHLFGLTDPTVLQGEPPTEPVRFLENGLHFAADVLTGQKTGFFLDQRENRARVESLAQGKSVLNVFAYTGGFSLYAARGGATAVTSVDISQPALDAAKQNFSLNPALAQIPHEMIRGDAFQVLAEMGRHGRTFDMVIIDPPAFAKKKADVEKAMGAYGRLVTLGLGVLRNGGTLVMASCSSRVAAADFFELVAERARGAGRPLRHIQTTGHALDHPIRFKEGAYLKCLFAVA